MPWVVDIDWRTARHALPSTVHLDSELNSQIDFVPLFLSSSPVAMLLDFQSSPDPFELLLGPEDCSCIAPEFSNYACR